jgi:hypothetical protein
MDMKIRSSADNGVIYTTQWKLQKKGVHHG